MVNEGNLPVVGCSSFELRLSESMSWWWWLYKLFLHRCWRWSLRETLNVTTTSSVVNVFCSDDVIRGCSVTEHENRVKTVINRLDYESIMKSPARVERPDCQAWVVTEECVERTAFLCLLNPWMVGAEKRVILNRRKWYSRDERLLCLIIVEVLMSSRESVWGSKTAAESETAKWQQQRV